jgi:hypothetical protein
VKVDQKKCIGFFYHLKNNKLRYMSSDNIKNISLVFSENPIARGYLYLLLKKNLNENKIIYLDNKLIFNNFFLKLRYNLAFKNTKKYLKSQKILPLVRNIEKYFDLDENFLIEMYNFENIFKFKNIAFTENNNINNHRNVKFFNELNEKNFLNTTNKILKNIFTTNKNFFHIHPGYLYKIRGADGTLNSIKYFNEIGASFYLMDEKIDNGKIIKRFRKNFNKISFPHKNEFSSFDLYNIWFSFFDPALRVSLLKKMIQEDINIYDFLKIDKKNEKDSYYSFIDKKELGDLFINKIFL